ncbi:MAG: hypothetical protein ACPLKP_02045 [Microgenomates group bacterium]
MSKEKETMIKDAKEEIKDTEEERYWEALKRYQEMLDYYGISDQVQAIVINAILELPPAEAIEEINTYWEDYLKDKNNNPTRQQFSAIPDNQTLHQKNLRGLSPAQKEIYEYRREVIKGIYEKNRGRRKK